MGILVYEEDLLTGEVDEGEDKDVLVFEVIEPVLPRAMSAVCVVVRSDWTREQTESRNLMVEVSNAGGTCATIRTYFASFAQTGRFRQQALVSGKLSFLHT